MRSLILAFGAYLGVAALLASPVPPALQLEDTLSNRLLLLMQPALLVGVALVLGAVFAPKAQLGTPVIDAVLAGRPAWAVIRGWLVTVLAVALVCGLLLVGLQMLAADLLPDTAAAAQQSVLVRVLYGGITEEVIARWGLMSLLAWLALKVIPPGAAMIAALSVVGVLFGLAHLPLLWAHVENPSATQAAVVVIGNLPPGLLFGWLFWRYGLEAAMAAHAATHLIALAVAALLRQ